MMTIGNVSLTPLTKDKIELLRTWRNSPDISKYMYSDTVITSEMQEKWFDKISVSEQDKYWLINSNNEPIGVLYFNGINQIHKRCYWGFYIGDASKQGGGIGSKVEFMAIEYAFNNLGMSKLCCEVLDFNIPVMKLHNKFGFEEEGVLKRHIHKDGKEMDVHQFGLFPKKWKEIKPRIEAIVTRKG